MKDNTIPLAIIVLVLFLALFPCLFLIITGTVTLSVSGFAVDSNGRLYIGAPNKIEVYEDGEIVATINPKTSRAYVFTITDEDKILLSTVTEVYVLDIEGNILEENADPGANTYNQLSYRKSKFISKNGDIYKLRNFIGRTKVVKNGTEVVYQINTLSVIVKIIIICCSLGMVCLAFTQYIIQREQMGKDIE